MAPATAENGWIETLESDQPAVLAKAHHIMATIHYCTLSTCSADGIPWVSPVFFAYDPNWHLYWSSTIAAQHSQNLYHNQGRAAIAIYDSSVSEGSGKGLYLSGSAAEVEPPLVGSIMKLLFQRAGNHPDPTPQDYLDASPRRIYCFQPQVIWISGERLAIGKQLVDTKVLLPLSTVLGQPVSEGSSPSNKT
jgi:hypothetical protein